MTRDVGGRRLLRRGSVRAGLGGRTLGALWCGVLLAAVGGGVPAHGAQPLSVTYVARDCPDRTDIGADKTREDSPPDLGPDAHPADAGTVVTSASVMGDDGEQRPVGPGAPFAVRPGTRTVFRVAPAFTPPSPAPSPHPSASPRPRAASGQLPHAGDDKPWLAPTAGLSFALLLGGGVLLRLAWVRRPGYEE